MDTIIQFTPAQLIAIATAIITISTACGIIVNLVTKKRMIACNSRGINQWTQIMEHQRQTHK